MEDLLLSVRDYFMADSVRCLTHIMLNRKTKFMINTKHAGPLNIQSTLVSCIYGQPNWYWNVNGMVKLSIPLKLVHCLLLMAGYNQISTKNFLNPWKQKALIVSQQLAWWEASCSPSLSDTMIFTTDQLKAHIAGTPLNERQIQGNQQRI